jgi:hypothetical protein
MVVPVQAISLGGSSTWRVEVRVLGPDFHRNTVPCWTGPWSVTDLTFGFQDVLNASIAKVPGFAQRDGTSAERMSNGEKQVE